MCHFADVMQWQLRSNLSVAQGSSAQEQQQPQQQPPRPEANLAANMPSTAKNAHAAASSTAQPQPPPLRAQTTAGTEASRAAKDSSRAVFTGPAPAAQASSAVKPSGGVPETPAVPKLMSWAARVSTPGVAPGSIAAPLQQRSQPQSPASTAQHAQRVQQPGRPAAQSAASSDIVHMQAEEGSAHQLTSSAPAEEAVQEGSAETSPATQDSSATAEKIKVGSSHSSTNNGHDTHSERW